LIAEVAEVNPALVARNAEGAPESVHYEMVNAMLLNEFLKAHQKMDTQDREIHQQEATIAELKSGMQALAAAVGAQTAELRQIHAELQIKNSAVQLVVNNH
jgi:hypothetical protein